MLPWLSRRSLLLALCVATAAPAGAQLPRSFTGPRTAPEITATDLMTRLYIFADDSMMGRQVGTIYNAKGTAYIEREVRALGLIPAGDSGTYFQNLPFFSFHTDSLSSLVVGGQRLVLGTDYLPVVKDERRISLDGVSAIYGGSSTDSSTWLTADEAAGRLVLVGVPQTTSSFPPLNRVLRTRLARSAAILIASLDNISPRTRDGLGTTASLVRDDTIAPPPPFVFITRRVASLMFGTLERLTPRAEGKALSGVLILHRSQLPSRNVVAVLPGSDPVLRGQYIAIGAHNDHIGFNEHPVDHDSLRATNRVLRPQGDDSPLAEKPSAQQSAAIRKTIDSLHRAHPARLDSIYNGADDDGSGSMSVLEIAEAFATAGTYPKRSLLFVWHSGEEEGMWGSEFFTDHPSVPRDSIVAQINVDMIGRGDASDITGESKTGALLRGRSGYLQLIGARRQSSELGSMLEAVNARGKPPLTFDYEMDANGHPQNIYCRSDHYEYARYGIPIVFLTTGGHADYHQVTDEPQYINYGHMTQVAQFIHASVAELANLDHRLVLDKPKPDPKGRCSQ
ncbi:MAG: M28 family peptidase [Gemmatimonadota bacterium]